MNRTEKIAEKRKYNNPVIVCVKLDNEISLALESAPPVGPSETNNTMTAPEYFSSEPFNANLG